MLSVMTNRYDLIGTARRLLVFALQTWDRRTWGSARGQSYWLDF